MKKLELLIPPPIVAGLTALLIWLLHLISPQFWFDFSGKKFISALFILAGMALGLLAIYYFRKAATSLDPAHPQKAERIVQHGVYHYSRNPMYLALFLVLTGSCFYFGSWPGILSLPVFILFMNRFQIKPEERILSEKFGKEYEAYFRSTHRWLGRVSNPS